jgi:hypothetical protein
MKNFNNKSTRLSFEDIKKNSVKVKSNLEKICGGNNSSCHIPAEKREVYIFGIDMTWLYGHDWYPNPYK